MDPNACLETIDDLVESDQIDRETIVDNITYLAEWLARDGFEPDWISYPAALSFLKNLSFKEERLFEDSSWQTSIAPGGFNQISLTQSGKEIWCRIGKGHYDINRYMQ